MQDQPTTETATQPAHRVDERTLDPHTLRVVANTMRGEAETIRKQASGIATTNAKRNRAAGAIGALTVLANHLDGVAVKAESGEGRPA